MSTPQEIHGRAQEGSRPTATIRVSCDWEAAG